IALIRRDGGHISLICMSSFGRVISPASKELSGSEALIHGLRMRESKEFKHFLVSATDMTTTLDDSGRAISYLCMTCYFWMLHQRIITLDDVGRAISYLCMTCYFWMLYRRTITLDDVGRAISYLCTPWCL
ncbi:hypothetical protein Tco_1017152, partial [Tanacetum coccineum]